MRACSLVPSLPLSASTWQRPRELLRSLLYRRELHHPNLSTFQGPLLQTPLCTGVDFTAGIWEETDILSKVACTGPPCPPGQGASGLRCVTVTRQNAITALSSPSRRVRRRHGNWLVRVLSHPHSVSDSGERPLEPNLRMRCALSVLSTQAERHSVFIK